MNLRTTLILLVLVAAGFVLYRVGPALPPWLDPTPRPAPVADAGTRATLDGLRAADVEAVEVRRDDRAVKLRRGQGGAWSLPGQWPTRQEEVRSLVDLLTRLHSRFEPIPVGADADLKKYGLEPPALTVLLETGKRKYTLAFGEEQTAAGPAIARPTYLRLDDNPEVVRLGPGLVALLDRPADYYQQRRLFPAE